MSVSTDGILCYGVDAGEEPEFPWLDLEDEDGDSVSEEDWYCDLMGCSNTKALWDEYYVWAETEEGKAEAEKIRAANSWKDLYRVYEELYPAWRESMSVVYDERRKVKETMPFEIVRHCSGDYPMYIVAVPGSVCKASRGEPVAIQTLDVDFDKLSVCAGFCAQHGIPFENPQWLLASMWW